MAIRNWKDIPLVKGVTDEQWNDWHWQVEHRLTTVEAVSYTHLDVYKRQPLRLAHDHDFLRVFFPQGNHCAADEIGHRVAGRAFLQCAYTRALNQSKV